MIFDLLWARAPIAMPEGKDAHIIAVAKPSGGRAVEPTHPIKLLVGETALRA
jgi:hypothetical protein